MVFRLFGHANPVPAAEEPSVAAASDDQEIVVYGTGWCGDCHRSRRFLDQHQIHYRWVDVDREPGATELVVAINHGRRSVPTIVFPDGSTLTEPSNAELGRKLGITDNGRIR